MNLPLDDLAKACLVERRQTHADSRNPFVVATDHGRRSSDDLDQRFAERAAHPRAGLIS